MAQVWRITGANARQRDGKRGKELVITGAIVGPNGPNKTHQMTLTSAQLKGATLDTTGYKPGESDSVIVLTRPESSAKRGRKASKGQPAATLTSFLKSVQ